MKSAIAGWAAIVLFGALPSPSLTAESFHLDVASAKTGDLPAGWSIAKTGEGPGGVWAVVEDATAPGGKAVAQTSDQGPNRLFCICVADGTSFKDVDLTVSFKAVAGKLDQGGGPVWRYRDANNYYIARMNPLEDNYRVYKVVNGKRTQLGSADVKLPAGEWHSLRVVHSGDQIRCYLGDRLYLEVKDDTFGDAGKVGLWTKADAQTRFAGLRVTTAAPSLQPSSEDQLPSAPPARPGSWRGRTNSTATNSTPRNGRLGPMADARAAGGARRRSVSTARETSSSDVHGRRQAHGRLRHDPGQVRASLRLLRRPHSASKSARPLVGVLDHRSGGRQGRRRGHGTAAKSTSWKNRGWMNGSSTPFTGTATARTTSPRAKLRKCRAS